MILYFVFCRSHFRRTWTRGLNISTRRPRALKLELRTLPPQRRKSAVAASLKEKAKIWTRRKRNPRNEDEIIVTFSDKIITRNGAVMFHFS